MLWQSVACFFGGVFLANFVPHFVTGVSGRPFPSPFATPPFRGLSSPVVNVLWGLINLAAAYALLALVARLEPQDVPRVLVAAADPSELVPLDEVEKRYVLRVLEAVGGNRTRAAEILRVDRKTLYSKLKAYLANAPKPKGTSPGLLPFRATSRIIWLHCVCH